LPILDLKYLQHLEYQNILNFDEAGGGGDGKNLALQDIRFQELLIEIQQSMIGA
jgi:hypothetical protein